MITHLLAIYLWQKTHPPGIPQSSPAVQILSLLPFSHLSLGHLHLIHYLYLNLIHYLNLSFTNYLQSASSSSSNGILDTTTSHYLLCRLHSMNSCAVNCRRTAANDVPF